MGRLKLMTIIGTRPEIIRLSEVIKKCDRYFDHFLVHTGQNYDYELNQIFFEDLSLRAPDCHLAAAGRDLGETIGNIIARSYGLMAERMPDALLVLGDTNSCLSAISAKRLHIPIFHMEAGNRCFDERLPEETNRRIVDHIADVNLCYSEHARRYLNSEGTAKERTYVTGSPMAEVLSANLGKIMASRALDALGVEPKRYILLSAHREENVDSEGSFLSLMGAVNEMAGRYGLPVIYSAHPRSSKLIGARGFQFHENVRAMSPFSFSDYNCLQLNAFCVVSDSGTLPEECAYFSGIGSPFPAVCIRTSTERPEALDRGHFVIAGISAGQVLQAIDVAVGMCRDGDLGCAVPDYADVNVSSKVVKLIQSYAGIVKHVVWREQRGDEPRNTLT
jgi:UDP-N-acetylglucosamine 2-epimerase (non-hydrolysing)